MRTHDIKYLTDTNHPYLIKKNSFGIGVPEKDIHLSGHHRIVLRKDDGTFLGVQTFKLEQCIKDDTLAVKGQIIYYHIVLEDRTESIVVNNVPVESCVE